MAVSALTTDRQVETARGGQGGDGSGAKLTLRPFCADSEQVDTIAPILTALTALVVAVAALLRDRKSVV